MDNEVLQCEYGFATVASGGKKYYRMASNLVFSYKKSKQKIYYPFVLITEKNNKYTKGFDQVIYLENFYNNVYDKLKIIENPLFKNTIFIESDFLIIDDISFLFSYFVHCKWLTSFGDDVNRRISDWVYNKDILRSGFFDCNGNAYYITSSILFLRYNKNYDNLIEKIHYLYNIKEKIIFYDKKTMPISKCDEVFFSILIGLLDETIIPSYLHPQLYYPWEKDKTHLSPKGIYFGDIRKPVVHFGSHNYERLPYQWLFLRIKVIPIFVYTGIPFIICSIKCCYFRIRRKITKITSKRR